MTTPLLFRVWCKMRYGNEREVGAIVADDKVFKTMAASVAWQPPTIYEREKEKHASIFTSGAAL